MEGNDSKYSFVERVLDERRLLLGRRGAGSVAGGGNGGIILDVVEGFRDNI